MQYVVVQTPVNSGCFALLKIERQDTLCQFTGILDDKAGRSQAHGRRDDEFVRHLRQRGGAQTVFDPVGMDGAVFDKLMFHESV